MFYSSRDKPTFCRIRKISAPFLVEALQQRVLCVSVANWNHRDTETTEVAQRLWITILNWKLKSIFAI